MDRGHGGARTSGGFTLLEMMLVILILGILGALTVPRLMGGQDRAFDLAAEQVNDIVLMYAHRAGTSTQACGLRYDEELRQVELLLLESNGEGAYFWRIDPLAHPVRLPLFVEADGLSIFADAEYVDTTQWPLTAMPGEQRPHIELELSWMDRLATISLPPYAMSPSLLMDGTDGQFLAPIDLDAAGAGREEW